VFRDGGLERALRETGTRLARGGAIVRVSVHGQQRSLDERIERNLLRIGQEAIANALRHGAASRVEVEVWYRDEEVALHVVDNGSGFEVDSAWRPAHYGMVGMRERAAEIMGTCEVRSTLGRGTHVEIHAPA
jgi:signal transduction histidine kinase